MTNLASPLDTISQILATTDLFQGLTPEQIARVATVGNLITLEAGQVLFEENSASDEMYIVARGDVEILVDPNLVQREVVLEPVIIARLVKGDLLGEMALVDQGLRSATARAGSNEALLVRIPRNPLLALCRAQPALGFALMHNLAADMALKIRNTGLTLRQYQLQLMYRSSQ